MHALQVSSLPSVQAVGPVILHQGRIEQWVLENQIFGALGALFTLGAALLSFTACPLPVVGVVAFIGLGLLAYGFSYQSLLVRYAAWVRSLTTLNLPDDFILQKFTDVQAFYGSRFSEALLFSQEQERALCAEIAKYEQLIQFRATPIEFFREKCGKVFGQEVETVVENLLPQMSETIEQCAKAATLKDLDALGQVVDQMKELINIQELRDLEGRLKAEVGDELARQVMGDWGYIGLDIRDNRGLFTEKRKGQILAKAQEAHRNKAEVDRILAELKAALERECSTSDVLAKYDQLSLLMPSMPSQRRQQLQEMVARALITREIRNTSRLQGSETEVAVLKGLGYDMQGYDDKMKVQDSLKSVMQEILQQPDLAAFKTFKQQLDEFAVRERLRCAKVPEEEIPNVLQLMQRYQEKKQELLTIAKRHEGEFEQKLKISLPKARRMILQFNEMKNTRAIKKALRSSLRDLDHLDIQSVERLFSHTDGYTEKAMAWFEKYQEYFVSEFTQAEGNDNRCLTDGVCYALCARIAQHTLVSPKISTSVIRIVPRDRMLQATYSAAYSQQKMLTFPPEILAKKKVKQEVCFIAEKTRIVEALTDQLGKLQASNGGVILGRGGHATFMRLDAVLDQFLFFDSNFGTMDFSKKRVQNNEERVLFMATCYHELYEWAYPDSNNLVGSQLLPLSQGESIPNGELDLSTVKQYGSV